MTGQRARSHLRVSVGLLATGSALAAMLIVDPGSAYATASGPDLRSAAGFAALAGSTVTNTGPTVITGDLGVSPGSAVTGFPPGTVTGGAIHAGDAGAAQAQIDVAQAYGDAAGQAGGTSVSGDIGDRTLTPGVYNALSSVAITGTLTLDAQGDPSAVFLFQAGSTLITASASNVDLINGASACNVFWQVGSSATLGTSSTFAGTILALTSITIATAANLTGRALARNGAVTLDTNSITAPQCPVAPGAPTALSAASASGAAALTFRPPANDGGSAITGYEYSTDAGANWHALTTADGTTVGTKVGTVSGLTDGTLYTITVRARNTAGPSTAATPTQVTPFTTPVVPTIMVPGPPTGLVATPGNGGAGLTFRPPANDGGSPITGYEVSTDGSSTWSALSTAAGAAGARTATVTGLTDGTPYAVRVRAINIAGTGTPSNSVTVTTGVSPTAVSVQGGTSSLVVSWHPPAGGATVTGYLAVAHPGPATCTTTGALSCVLGGVAGTSYTVTVTATVGGVSSVPSASSGSAVPTAPAVADIPPATSLVLTTDKGAISTAAPGQGIVIIGTGFAAFSTVILTLYSDPVVLQSVVTDTNGSLATPVTIPTSLSAGGHTITAAGVGQDGVARTMNLAVNIRANAVISAPGPLTLPVTGLPVSSIAPFGLAVLATGAALFLAARPRRRITEGHPGAILLLGRRRASRFPPMSETRYRCDPMRHTGRGLPRHQYSWSTTPGTRERQTRGV